MSREPAVTVTAYPDGPLVVRGDFAVRTEDDAEIHGPVVALCRCGRSGRPPLCDGTHRKPRGRRRPG